jgi:hypothetical protein
VKSSVITASLWSLPAPYQQFWNDLSALQFRCLTIKAANVPAAGRKFLAATMCL